jgi:hypothetical protein
MKNPITFTIPDYSNVSGTESIKVIENHKKTASHLLAAATEHFKAANYLKLGNYEKAAESAMLAREYLNLASQAKRDDIQNSAFNGEITI